MKRSIWGLVRVYNALGDALTCCEVKGFQWMLQERAKAVVSKKLDEGGDTLFSPR